MLDPGRYLSFGTVQSLHVEGQRGCHSRGFGPVVDPQLGEDRRTWWPTVLVEGCSRPAISEFRKP